MRLNIDMVTCSLPVSEFEKKSSNQLIYVGSGVYDANAFSIYGHDFQTSTQTSAEFQSDF
jgi:hypothetical protein